LGDFEKNLTGGEMVDGAGTVFFVFWLLIHQLHLADFHTQHGSEKTF
jgi:hypothetical protein